MSYNPTISGSPGARSRLKNSTQINGLTINIYEGGAQKTQTQIDTQSTVKTRHRTYKRGYNAVFLDNGQVYFGKLETISSKRFVKLTDIFYLQDESPTIMDGQASVGLTKLGNEIHGPRDEMNIKVSHIVFWEKLRDDGPVVSAIIDYKQNS